MAMLTLLGTSSMLEALSSDWRVPRFMECWSSMEPRSTGGGVGSVTDVVFDHPITSPADVQQIDRAVDPRVDSRLDIPVTLRVLCVGTSCCAERVFVLTHLLYSSTAAGPAVGSGQPCKDCNAPSGVPIQASKPVALGQASYYKNKLEFSLDGGWLPINIPFVFDVFLGDAYNTTSLKYTLVPIIASIRWQMNSVGGPWIFRGNWDLSASAATVLIPRGPETHYTAWIMGIRRNFVPHRGRIAPYFDGRLGMGRIDAKEPVGVLYAQGQDFTFTVNMGSGVRYNFGPRYSISAGLNWMHISNLYLSEPKFANYGINVYGPMFGINMRIGGFGRHAPE